MKFADRLTHVDLRTGLTVALPGGALLFDVTRQVRLFAGVHRGFTPPPPQDAATTGAELSTNYELGGRFTGSNDARVELTGFFSDYDNMTSQCTLTAGCTEIDHVFNSGRVLVWGLESAAGYTFQVGPLEIPVQAAYTYTGSSFRTGFASADPQLGTVKVGDSLPYIPEHQVLERLSKPTAVPSHGTCRAHGPEAAPRGRHRGWSSSLRL